MKKQTLVTLLLLGVACGLCWYFGRVNPGEIDNVREVACRTLIENTDPGFNSGESPQWEYFAISFDRNEDPSTTFLKRFADVSPQVMSYSEALKLEPKDVLQTKGMYVLIKEVEPIGWGKVRMQASVGCGWAAAMYELVLTRSWNGWRCQTCRRTAVS